MSPQLPAAGQVLAVIATLANAVMADSLASTAPSVAKARVLHYKTRIYRRRDPFSPTLRLAAAGETYDVYTSSGTWYEVVLPDGQTGWVAARHLDVKPTRAAGPGGAGSGREVLGALAGTLAGGTATTVCLGAALAWSLKGFGFLKEVHGSGAVSQTTISMATGAGLASAVLTPAAAAYGAYTLGESERPGGSIWLSCVGAAVGGVAGNTIGYGLDALLSLAVGETVYLFSGLGGVVGTTAGAVIGYRKSKPPRPLQLAWARRVNPPALGLAPGNPASGQTSWALQLNLLALQF